MSKKTKPYITINYNTDNECAGFEVWHRYHGKWIHIVQKYENKDIIYYTNGKKEK